MYLFQNALAMDPQNISLLVLVMALAAWVGILIVLVIDLFSNRRLSSSWKLVWFPILLGLPLLGGVLYSAFSLTRHFVDVRSTS